MSYFLTAISILLACLPLCAQVNISVEGRGIDIRPLKIGTPLYPTGSSPKFSSYRDSPHQITAVSEPLKGMDYATVPVIDDDKRKDYILNRVQADTTGDLLIGIANPNFQHPGWQRIPGVFKTKHATYYRYRHAYPKSGEWLDLPPTSAHTGKLPIIVYGKTGHLKFANPLPVPGNVIVSETAYPGAQAVFNPSLIILPDGDYLANCSMRGHCPTFRSSDRGLTWKLVSDPGLPLSFQSLFEHRGNLYLLGKAWLDKKAPVDGKSAVLYQSTDQGKTWSSTPFIFRSRSPVATAMTPPPRACLSTKGDWSVHSRL